MHSCSAAKAIVAVPVGVQRTHYFGSNLFQQKRGRLLNTTTHDTFILVQGNAYMLIDRTYLDCVDSTRNRCNNHTQRIPMLCPLEPLFYRINNRNDSGSSRPSVQDLSGCDIVPLECVKLNNFNLRLEQIAHDSGMLLQRRAK